MTTILDETARGGGAVAMVEAGGAAGADRGSVRRRLAVESVGGAGHRSSMEAARDAEADQRVLEALQTSAIFHDYERAFEDATGLPLALRPVETWQLPHRGNRKEHFYCSLMSQKSAACAACLQVQQRLSEAACDKPAAVECEAGFCEMAAPVRLGDRVIGLLQAGQVLSRKPTPGQFEKASKLLKQWGVVVDHQALKEAYFGTKVLSKLQQEAILKLLSIFADHLSLVSNQIAVRQANAEPPLIQRAKRYIAEHSTEELSLGQVAKAVNASVFYFCKQFRKHSGVHFTEYVARIRIENARNLLINPNLRVSEVAYEVGFQSLTHFNRLFRKFMGTSPTEYRAQRLNA